MRILIASDFYPPFIGGAERQTYLLSTGLAQRGHEVRVATVWHADLPEEAHDDGVVVHRLRGLATRVPWFSNDPGRRYHPPLPEPGIVWGLRRLVRRWNPDVVHASGWISYSCAAALLGTGIPLVSSARDYGYSCAVRTLLRDGTVCDGPGLRKCLQCASHVYGTPKAVVAVGGVWGAKSLLRRRARVIHCVSSYVERIMRRDFLAGGRAEQRKTTVIPDFVVEAQGSAEDEHTVAAYVERLPREPFILFVGSLQGHKGIYTLLEAYQHLDQRPPLVLMGTVWPDSPRSYPPGVTVLHHVPHAAVMEAYRRCLFGVAPSLCPETFGGVITEAMLMNKAVVASNIGGPLDIVVDDATGFLVPPGDVAALRTTMERLLRDGALRERLGAAGRERVRRFDADVVVPQFETLYAELAARTNTRRPALDTHV